MISREQAQAVTGDSETWYVPLRDAMELNGIDTPQREAMFIAQFSHESGGFKSLTESLNYSPESLRRVFGKYFTAAELVSFAHDEERIANRVYANRMGNGDEASGDGFRFRGRGGGITGRANYRAGGRVLGIDLENNPELASDPLHAALLFAHFWEVHGCNELADAGEFETITRRINGGLNGLDDRLARLDKVNEALA